MTRPAGFWFDAFLLPPCLSCSRRFDPADPGPLCAGCRARWPGPDSGTSVLPGLAGVAAAWPYLGPVRELLVQAKEEPRSPAVALLAPQLHAVVLRRSWPVAAVSWAPASRRRREGWHLAAGLACALRRRLGWPPGPRLRKRRAPPQTGLGGAERRRNLRDSMRVRCGRRPPPRRVLLVDDVLTTGATLREAARALRAAGVAEVRALAVARVLEPPVRGAARPRPAAPPRLGARAPDPP